MRKSIDGIDHATILFTGDIFGQIASMWRPDPGIGYITKTVEIFFNKSCQRLCIESMLVFRVFSVTCKVVFLPPLVFLL